MRIPRNKQNRIVNKEYSRLPYWTDEGYEDIQKQTSQKYIQDTYGAFAESENQLPYLSDADYQGLEYQYQNPEFFDPTDLPDVDFTDTAPKGTCYELWDSLFGHRTRTFIPTDSEWSALREYNKKCPLIYMPHTCCSESITVESFVGVNGPVRKSSSNIKIHGPSSVKVNETAEYTISGGLTGCAYEMDATGGEFIGSKYFAPDTAGEYEIWITPVLADDKDKKCAKKTVTVGGIWEDWDDSLTPILCKNHTWNYKRHSNVITICPELPDSIIDGTGSSLVSLTNGVLNLTLQGTSSGERSIWLWLDQLVTPNELPVLVEGKMKIKCTTSISSGFNYIGIFTSGKYLFFHYYAATNPPFYLIGPGDGTEKVIDLFSYGVPAGRLTDFRIVLSVSSTTPATKDASILIDYIDFK